MEKNSKWTLKTLSSRKHFETGKKRTIDRAYSCPILILQGQDEYSKSLKYSEKDWKILENLSRGTAVIRKKKWQRLLVNWERSTKSYLNCRTVVSSIVSFRYIVLFSHIFLLNLGMQWHILFRNLLRMFKIWNLIMNLLLDDSNDPDKNFHNNIRAVDTQYYFPLKLLSLPEKLHQNSENISIIHLKKRGTKKIFEKLKAFLSQIGSFLKFYV